MTNSGLAVFRVAQYRRVWAALAASSAGTIMQRFVVAYFLTAATGHARWAGAVIAGAWIARSVTMLVAGGVIDRFGPRAVLIATSAAQCVPALMLVLAFASRTTAPLVIVAIEMISGALTGFEIPARISILPALVKAAHLRQGSIVGAASEKFGFLIGPLLGAALIGHVSYSLLFSLNALTFVGVGAIAWSTTLDTESEVERPPFREAFINGALAYRKPSEVRSVAILGLLGALTVCPVTALIAPMATLALHGGPSATTFLAASFGFGSFLGLLAGGRLGERLGYERVMSSGMVIAGPLLAIYALAPSLLTAAICLSAVAATQSVALEASTVAFIQHQTPPLQRGSVIALYLAAWNATFALGSIGLAMLADWSDIRTVEVCAGLAFVLARFTGFFRSGYVTVASRGFPARAMSRSLRAVFPLGLCHGRFAPCIRPGRLGPRHRGMPHLADDRRGLRHRGSPAGLADDRRAE